MPRPTENSQRHRLCARLASICTVIGLLTAPHLTRRGTVVAAAEPPPRSAAIAHPTALPQNRAAPPVIVHRAPKPLAEGAVTSDWTHFLGPNNNCTSPETPLLKDWPEGGPELVWEMRTNEGYATPAIQGQRLVYFQRIGNEEVVQCLGAETGEQYWDFHYPTDYEDSFGYSSGPRCPPVIDGDRVYTYGAQGKLHCFEIATGKLLWQRDILAENKLRQNFFGVGDTPLVEGDLVIVNVGAAAGPCAAAFDKRTGKLVWGVGDEWTPGYSTPIAADIHGKRRVFVFSGGESYPAKGGLLSIDPVAGKLDFRFPWRSRSSTSVNASPPVVIGNRVFVSASYRTGGALLNIKPDFTYEVLWQNENLGTHWMCSVHKDGYLYGFDGRNEPDASLVCVNLETGERVWREVLEWPEKLKLRGEERTFRFSPFRGTLLEVDGHFLCLGELGHLLWLDLSPEGPKILKRAWLVQAEHTWGMPVISHGLLYINQNERGFDDTQPRFLCYDLRGP